MSSTLILLLPGWQNSGPNHWQSRWEALYGDVRVLQHDWMRPLRGDWMAQLDTVIQQQTQPVVLAAHSLGCLLIAAWAACTAHANTVRGALLVAPGDPEQPALQAVLHSWRPVPLQALPFPSVLIGSQTDPYCSAARAQTFARAWGCTWLDYGDAGHINADSQLGDWPEGREILKTWL